MIFRDYLRTQIKENESLIEFGPLTRPLFSKKEKKNVFYADIRSTEDIKKLYTGNDYLNKTGLEVDIEAIVDIDYVIKDTYKKVFKDKKFDAAYLSHVIEHMPSIIDFFIEIAEVLNDNGKLYIIYPDKRYCFDHFRNEVSFRDAYATFKYGIKENARLAFDFAYNVVHENNPVFFWNNQTPTSIISSSPLSEGDNFYQKVLRNEIIDDVHLWPFSCIGFLKFISEMQRAKLLNFEIEEFYPTEENNQEFMVILRKTTNPDKKKTLELMEIHSKTSRVQELENKCYNYEKRIQDLTKDIEKQTMVIVNYDKELNKVNNMYENDVKRQNEIIANYDKQSRETIEMYEQRVASLTKDIQTQSEVIANYDKQLIEMTRMYNELLANEKK